MALVNMNQRDAKEIGDITTNLPSLQFESALTDGEKDILVLRKRSHAITVHGSAQATYMVSVLNEARQIHAQLRNPEKRRATRLLGDGMAKNSLKIGIIGCGRLGSHLANCLLSFGESNPEDITISTRRPETLIELQDKGILCFHDNRQVSSSVHLLFLCVLPSQFPVVAEDIRGHLSPHCLVYSFISSLSVLRLKQLLNYNNVIKPEFLWDLHNSDRPWDISKDPEGIFSNPRLLEQTCPLSFFKPESVVTTEDKFGEAMVYAFINMCTNLGLHRKETVDVVNAVLLGHTASSPVPDLIRIQDITRLTAGKTDLFPKFDLSSVTIRETPLTQRLIHHEVVRQAFVDRYCAIFLQYLTWKNQQAAKR